LKFNSIDVVGTRCSCCRKVWSRAISWDRMELPEKMD